MPIGPGKYDDLCTYVREQSKAEGAIVIVLNGSKGDGMSCQAPFSALFAFESILRDVADQIRDSINRGHA